MTHRPTDATLAAAFVEGRPGARDALLAHWLPRVLRWAARLGGPSIDPEDIAQEVFIVVIRRLADVEDLSKASAWLYGVTRKVVAQHRRRAWLRRWVPGASTERASEQPGPDSHAEKSQLGQAVHDLLDKLPATQREALVLVDLEERPTAEAAELIGIPLGTLKSRLRLGRARFRTLAERRDLASLLPAREIP